MMPAESRENPLLKKGNSDAFFEEKHLTKNKQCKLSRTHKRKLMGLGLPEWAACEEAYSSRAYWRMAGSGVVQRALTKKD